MKAPTAGWIIVTGGGSGIGRSIVHHFCRSHPILTCGRDVHKLQTTVELAPNPESIYIVACDVATADGREQLRAALPDDATVSLLVQNAAIGDPDRLADVSLDHLEHAFRVNVVAPLAIARDFMPALRRGKGRILHLGTSIAFTPQLGTTTYGVTKAAFHRLYRQLNAEDLGVPTASMSPGLVDTEGVRRHIKQSTALDLPHVKWFEDAFTKGWTTNTQELMEFIDQLIILDPHTYSHAEWRFSEWKKSRVAGGNATCFSEWAKAQMAIGDVNGGGMQLTRWSIGASVFLAGCAGLLVGTLFNPRHKA